MTSQLKFQLWKIGNSYQVVLKSSRKLMKLLICTAQKKWHFSITWQMAFEFSFFGKTDPIHPNDPIHPILRYNIIYYIIILTVKINHKLLYKESSRYWLKVFLSSYHWLVDKINVISVYKKLKIFVTIRDITMKFFALDSQQHGGAETAFYPKRA